MNSCSFLAFVGLAIMVGTSLVSCVRTSDSQRSVGKSDFAANTKLVKLSGQPPLVVDMNTPLLLDEPTEAEKPSPLAAVRAMADNTACFVCHANYKEELLASRHAASRVGCVDCHGKSYAHCNDENNTTPPDVMYQPGEIGPSCQRCHQRHDVPADEVIVRLIERRLGQKDPKTIVCTDCHGQHRLKLRSVRWDKKTGKLVPQDTRRRTQEIHN